MNFNQAPNPIVRKIGVSDNVPIHDEEIAAFDQVQHSGVQVQAAIR